MWSRNLNRDFRLGDCLFGEGKLAKSVDLDKFGCSGFSTGFDPHSQFLLSNGEWGEKC